MVTGISGSGSKEFCEKYRQSRERVRIYNTGDMMRAIAEDALNRQIPAENFLNLHRDTLNFARYSAFGEIISNLERDRKNYDRIVVDTHTMFLWNSVYQRAYNWDLHNKIPTDMFVTIIDKPSAIRERQLQNVVGRTQEHSLRDILLWMQQEVETTGAIAEMYGKPHYIFSSKQNPQNVDSLLDNRILIYPSFPMTDANAETTQKIVDFKNELRGLRRKVLGNPDEWDIPLLDPADIDVETGEGLSESDRDAIGRHTVKRDLDWDIGTATHVISYYPNETTNLSAGVTHEYVEALKTGKDVYVICPRKRRSPFLDKNSIKFFETKEEFMAFFEKKIVEDLERFRRR